MHAPHRLALLLILVAAAGCATEERLVSTLTDDLDADGLDRLRLTIEDGDLSVEGDPDATTIAVEVDVVTAKGSEAKDEDALDATRLELVARSDGSAVLTVRFDPRANGYFHDVRVILPADFAVEADRTESADGETTSISGVASVSVDDRDGSLDVEDIAQGAIIDDLGGPLTLSGIEGDVLLVDGDGDATIEDVDGDVEIDDGDGDLYVNDVTGAVTIRDGRGDIFVDNVGSLDISEDSSGTVSVQ